MAPHCAIYDMFGCGKFCVVPPTLHSIGLQPSSVFFPKGMGLEAMGRKPVVGSICAHHVVPKREPWIWCTVSQIVDKLDDDSTDALDALRQRAKERKLRSSYAVVCLQES
eukprot:6179491-Amphidinium_carterae.1